MTIALAFASCENNPDLNPDGGRILFGADPGYQNYPETRTEYSGYDDQGRYLIRRDSEYERINWVANHDRIKILCEQALDVDGNANTSGIYQIETPSASGKKSIAGAGPASDTAPFYWGTGDHYFYALYPAAGTTSNYHSGSVTDADSSIESLTGNKAKITGTIPAGQGAVKSDNIYKPNMNLAYMYAAEKTARTWDGVSLHFHPLVTAFEFSLKAFDEQMAAVDLISLELSSTSTDLTGGFTATLDVDASTVATVNKASTGLGREITLTMPSDTRLSEDAYSVFTVLALGVDQTDLTLTLNFAGGLTRSLALTSVLPGTTTSGPIIIPACKKAYFKLDVSAPDEWEYFITNLNPITVAYTGGTGTLGSAFKSYKTKGTGSSAVTEAVPFVLEYSSSASGPWSTTCSWITPSGVNYDGSSSGQNFTAIIAPQANSGSDPHRTTLAARSPKSDFDLATKNVATGATVSRTTANCYVVDAPGTYKFPLVYGNAIVGNNLNQLAFRGNFHETGGYWYRYGYGMSFNYSGQTHWSNMLGTFRDHNNNLITSVDHNNQASKSDVYIAQKFSNLNAILVWEDSPGLVNVDYNISGSGENAYIKFSVPQANITEGNALIAVRSGSTILWSWHIWVTDRNLAAGVTAPSGKVFSPANIGWCDGKSLIFEQREYYVRARQTEGTQKTSNAVLITEQPYSKVLKGNNPYFQWGRKDPMQAGDGQNVTGDGHQNYKYYYSYTGYAPQHSSIGRASNLGVGIQNPHIEYNTNHVSPYNWVDIVFVYADGNNGNGQVAQFVNLWNSSVAACSSNDASEAFDRNVTKTIYDPSPVGYKVPNASAFNNLTTSNFTWTTVNGDVGRKYGDLFFPAVGGCSNGLYGVNTSGSYLAATENLDDGSCDVMEFTNSYVHYKGSYYTYMLNCWAVRPIRE